LKAPLTPEDIKSLRYECRPGIIFAVGMFLLTSFLAFLTLNVDTAKSFFSNYGVVIIATPVLIATAFLLYMVFNGKYLKDIRNNEKDQIRYTIQKKENKVDYKTGSASLWYTQKMKPSDHYLLTIDNCGQDVDKELFDRASVGDEVVLHMAPISGLLLKIELVK
jgi:hypothetical protein